MGSAGAWALADAGREVVVLEQHELGHDRGGSHGGSRLFRLDYTSAETLERAARSEQLWRQIEAESALSLLSRVGAVEHGVGRDRRDGAIRLCAEAGVRAEVLSAEEAARRWPQMTFDDAVVLQPDAGCMHADRAVAALQIVAARAGADLRARTPVRAIEVVEEGDGIGAGNVVVRTAEGTIRARHVVAAVGSWAPGLLGELVALPTITVTREQPRHFRVRDSAPDGRGWSEWPVFAHWRSEPGATGAIVGYGAFEDGLGVKVGLHRSGPVVDPDRRAVADAAVAATLTDYVRRWFPGLDADTSTPVSCLYDNSPDESFVIDRVGPLTIATGFSGEGFKFAPVVGELLRDLASGSVAAPEDFRLGRF